MSQNRLTREGTGAEIRDSEVACGAVRADQAGLAGRGFVDPGAGGPASCAPADGAAGPGRVDFGEFDAVIAGVLLKLWMFVMRLSCSGRAFHGAVRPSLSRWHPRY